MATSPKNTEARPAVRNAARRRAARRRRSPTRPGATWRSAHDNAILIFTGLSPSAHAASSTEDPSPGWWEDMIGPGRPIDTRRFFVICVNSLGSPFGSTSPASINPATGKPYRLTFPVLTVEDIARAGHEVARVARRQEARGRDRSVARRHDGAGLLRVVSGRDAQRRIDFGGGALDAVRDRAALAATGNHPRAIRPGRTATTSADAIPVSGMRLARKLGMITYRSAKEWAQRFGRERANAERKPGDPFGIDFEVESYLENHAAKFTGQFDPNCYLYISRAMDLFDLADHGGSVAEALQALHGRARAGHRRGNRSAVSDRAAAGTRRRPAASAAAKSQFAAPAVAAGSRFLPGRHGSVQAGDRRLSAGVDDESDAGDCRSRLSARLRRCVAHASPQRHSARNSAGSTIARFSATPQCRCGPVTRPVAPTVPIRSPAASRVADLHRDAVEMAVHRDQPVAVIDVQRVAVEEEVAGFDHRAGGGRVNRRARGARRCPCRYADCAAGR